MFSSPTNSRLPIRFRFAFARLLPVLFGLLLIACSAGNAVAAICPFCSAVAQTFAEQIQSSDVVVIASLQSDPSSPDEATLPRAKFRVDDTLKGSEMITDGDELVAVVVNRNHRIGDQFLLMGSGVDDVNWTTPMKTSERVIEYLKKLDSLPEKGAKRLEFFAEYFEDEETVLAYDAYDEFARAPYEDVKALKEQLDRKQLIAWIEDPDVMKSRKRLYYTLLGVCGGEEEELEFLEDILKSGDRDRQAGLDALIACYLTLKGDDGVGLVEELFLSNPKAEYIDVFSAIQALRFHGTESDKVSKQRIVGALRHVLDRPKMADMVIPDLARWEDWSIMERLVKMFKEANTDETSWVRTPIISYLQACPKPKAKKYITELREIDPEAVKRAEMLADLNWDDEDDGDEDDGEEQDDGQQTADSTDDGAVGGDKNSKNTGGGDTKRDKSADKENSGATLLVSHIDQNDTAPTSHDPAEKALTTDAPEIVTQIAGRSSVNPTSGVYVSMGNEPNNELGESEAGQLAQSSQAVVPLATTSPAPFSLAVILLVLAGVCVILFVLLWSVLNGWFDRLIF